MDKQRRVVEALGGWSGCPFIYGCSNWVREEFNFSNSNLRLRLYKPCFEIAVVMTNNLIWYYKLQNTHIKCHGKLHDHTKLWYSQGYFVQDNFCANSHYCRSERAFSERARQQNLIHVAGKILNFWLTDRPTMQFHRTQNAMREI
jgi:hypothetical protein